MTLWKRLKNLWALSEWEPSSKEIEKKAKGGDKFSMLFKKKRQAIIIEPNTYTDDIPTVE